jgi:hypothetical protein
MSLSKEVRTFFTSKIFVAIDAKIATLKEQTDSAEINRMAIKRYCDKNGLSDIPAMHAEIEKLEEKVKAKKDVMNTKIKNALSPKYSYYACYNDNQYRELTGKAISEFSKTIKEEKYPDQIAEIKRLQEMRDDVNGKVLLATTEPKLVATMKTLVEKYGNYLGVTIELPE